VNIENEVRPKERMIKYYKDYRSKLVRNAEIARREAGILSSDRLTADYFNTFLELPNMRFRRANLQKQYNADIRNMHHIHYTAEEVKSRIPLLRAGVKFEKPVQRPATAIPVPVSSDSKSARFASTVVFSPPATPYSTSSKRRPTPHANFRDHLMAPLKAQKSKSETLMSITSHKSFILQNTSVEDPFRRSNTKLPPISKQGGGEMIHTQLGNTSSQKEGALKPIKKSLKYTCPKVRKGMLPPQKGVASDVVKLELQDKIKVPYRYHMKPSPTIHPASKNRMESNINALVHKAFRRW